MLKKLCISLFFSNFVVSNQHTYLSLVIHNLYAKFVKILEICMDFSKDLVNERGNLPRRGVVSRFSDLEVISLSLTAEFMSIDSENLLFDRLKKLICDIINKSNLLLQLTVYEKDLPLMSEGRKMLFRINGLGNAMFDAEIASIDQSIDNNDYSIKVYARVKNNRAEFRPGMYVRARLVEE